MNPYRLLAPWIRQRSAPIHPRRIVLVLPCCIGDVVLATAALKALRRGYPDAHITWAVGSWSKGVIEHHDLLDAVLDTGPGALPVRTSGGMRRFVAHLRAGKFDLVVSLVRSLKGRYTIVLIEHKMDIIMSVSDRISVMHFGRLIAEGAPAEIQRNPEVRRAYLGGVAA